MNFIERMIGTVVGIAFGVADVIRREPQAPATVESAQGPSHPTHVWEGEAVYDSRPLPEAENPVEGVLSPSEWRELDHVAMLDNLCHGRDV